MSADLTQQHQEIPMTRGRLPLFIGQGGPQWYKSDILQAEGR